MEKQICIAVDERSHLLNGVPKESTTNRRGLLLMGGSMLLYSVAHVGHRRLAEEGFPSHEVILFRSLVAAITCALLARYFRISNSFLGPKGFQLVLLLRGVLGCAGVGLFIASLSLLDRNTAVVLSFLSPLLSLMMAYLFLGEGVPVMRVASILLGLVGVGIYYRPSFGFLRISGLAVAMAAAIANAGSTILVRHISVKGIHFIHLLGHASILPIIPAMIATGLFSEDPLDRVSWICFGWGLFASLASFLANLLFTLSLQTERVVATSSFVFLQIVFAFAGDFLIKGSIPSMWAPLGSLAILVSVYIGTKS